eukprot:INCI18854.2.p1 GENE.INCI18854.2~~INCI18854.2.p1  ORF type:complete len:283 (+),score=33.09 INCI18854.2:152-1000(+)
MNVTKRNRSFADITLGPSQSAEINKEPGVKGNAKGAPAGKKTQSGGPSNYWLYFFGLLFAVLGLAYLVHRPWFDAFVELAWECATFQRLPATAQDNFAAMMWSLFALPVIMVLDFSLCYPLSKSHVARWYFIHAGTNAIITVLAVPDLYFTLAAPARGLSVRYCESLPFPACSDLPTCFIVGLHLYHVLFFKLTKDDVFHHLLFVPVVCFAHFAFPCGSAANILCFFISGFPGGIDYFLLGLVKNKLMHPLKEKRLNCSINTWIRAPGITLRYSWHELPLSI